MKKKTDPTFAPFHQHKPDPPPPPYRITIADALAPLPWPVLVKDEEGKQYIRPGLYDLVSVGLRRASLYLQRGTTKGAMARTQQDQAVDPFDERAYYFCLEGALYRAMGVPGLNSKVLDYAMLVCKEIAQEPLFKYHDGSSKNAVRQLLHDADNEVVSRAGGVRGYNSALMGCGVLPLQAAILPMSGPSQSTVTFPVEEIEKDNL